MAEELASCPLKDDPVWRALADKHVFELPLLCVLDACVLDVC